VGLGPAAQPGTSGHLVRFGSMKMATWRHLIHATPDRIAHSERRIECQRQLIADLIRGGYDSDLSERELATPMLDHDQLQEQCKLDAVAILPHLLAG
jgi:hypothetical protein